MGCPCFFNIVVDLRPKYLPGNFFRKSLEQCLETLLCSCIKFYFFRIYNTLYRPEKKINTVQYPGCDTPIVYSHDVVFMGFICLAAPGHWPGYLDSAGRIQNHGTWSNPANDIQRNVSFLFWDYPAHLQLH